MSLCSEPTIELLVELAGTTTMQGRSEVAMEQRSLERVGPYLESVRPFVQSSVAKRPMLPWRRPMIGVALLGRLPQLRWGVMR